MIKELPVNHFTKYQPEKHLWAAVLASYVEDVIAFAKGKRPTCKATTHELRKAYEDFKGKQNTLVRLCSFCDLEPEWIARQIREKMQQPHTGYKVATGYNKKF